MKIYLVGGFIDNKNAKDIDIVLIDENIINWNNCIKNINEGIYDSNDFLIFNNINQIVSNKLTNILKHKIDFQIRNKVLFNCNDNYQIISNKTIIYELIKKIYSDTIRNI